MRGGAPHGRAYRGEACSTDSHGDWLVMFFFFFVCVVGLVSATNGCSTFVS